ncbi:MAG TPA: AMP-binding protein, partial [Candidatus Binatia bacterium]|nr:AMP-binding protein [Candidatus Binatia bacterium]
MSDFSPPWPSYRSAPPRLNLAAEVLGPAVAGGFGSRVALIGNQGTVSYASLQQTINGVAGGLIDRGVGRGDLVLIKMGNSVELATAF